MEIKRDIRKELRRNLPSKFIKSFIKYAKKYRWKLIKVMPGMTFSKWLIGGIKVCWHRYYKCSKVTKYEECRSCLCLTCKRERCSNISCQICHNWNSGQPTFVCSRSSRVTNKEF